MRVAVTGAGGFVGGAIAAYLAAAGHEVLALGRSDWDLESDGPAPRELASVDAVVHAAARVEPWGPPGPFMAATVRGTARLLDALGDGVRIVIIGSASVYDPRIPHLRANERDAPAADGCYYNAYARAKAAQERLVAERRPDAVVLRPRAVWGPGDTTLLPRLAARIRAGRLILPAGGRNPMSATHVTSLTTAVGAALVRPAVRGPVNAADASPTTAAGLLGQVFAAAGRDIRIVGVPGVVAEAAAAVAEAAWRAVRRATEPPLTRYAVAAFARPFTLDLTRLHDELGVAPDVDVPRAAEEVAADWHRAGS
ncbi:MAG: NAD-dependent epimerase/dehydratase family protein [Candidatus Limnocylindrales bacterium]